jgi:hypothetical protein
VIHFFRGACFVAGFTAVIACRPDAQFATNFAADFRPSGHRVSVFGVYKDGQMSSGAWSDLQPSVERALGGGSCEIAYGGALTSSNSVLSAAIDDYVRANGPTDNLLTQVAPAARGDLILVLTRAGRLPVHHHVSVADAPQPGGGRGARGRPTGDPNVLQLSASFFSVGQGRSVAFVDMQYSGESVDAAIIRFATRLSQSLPASTCSGWSANTAMDLERIRKLADE